MECWEISGWEALCKSSALLLVAKKIFPWYPQPIGEHISKKIAGWVLWALQPASFCTPTWWAVQCHVVCNPQRVSHPAYNLHRSLFTPEAGTLPCRIIIKFPHLQYMCNFAEVSNSYFVIKIILFMWWKLIILYWSGAYVMKPCRFSGQIYFGSLGMKTLFLTDSIKRLLKGIWSLRCQF